ncbi:MAG: hypothetical protein QNM02_02735 [Acidimicrobiia bacterium]|nr:hypothetical protein [Acidimicrobiia bacterium]
MSKTSGVKALLGYDIVDGVSVEDYEAWLAEVHFPDLLANPHLDRLVLNDVVRPITATSAGTPAADEPTSFYRIVEMQFADNDAYERYLEWFVANPIPEERSPAGRTDFGFYVLATSTVVDRDQPHQPPTR